MQDIHEKAPAEVVKINVGALKGACLKIECEKIYYFQRVYMSCYVPIIAPFQLPQTSVFIHNYPDL
ncbi:TPA: hypothetical protein MH291_25555 [Klebsiella pneumoniae]|nr:hypothetical protein [Klebsiella pneumoniae]